MSKLHTDTKPRTHMRRASRVLLVAAVIILGLSVGAVALWRLSLQNLEGPKTVFTEQGARSLSSIQGTTQYQAAAEWEAQVQAWFNKGENMLQAGQASDQYTMYEAHSQEAKDALDALLTKYGLKMHGMPSHPRTLDALYSAVGASGFMPASGAGGPDTVGGTLYEDGTFSFNGVADLPDVGSVAYKFAAFNNAYFSRGVYMLADRLEEAEEWTYTTTKGVEVLLALGSGRSILAADMDDCFISVNILAGSADDAAGNGGAPVLNKATLEAFAEAFDFAVINGLSS